MPILKFTIKPVTAFGTPLVGDTFFGQLCWAIREVFGLERLTECLQDYTKGNPFVVVSDAFPQEYVPLPTLPSSYWEIRDNVDRKVLKKRQWLSVHDMSSSSTQWQILAKSSGEIDNALLESYIQPHNTLNRMTHTTSEGNQFSPYETEQLWMASLWDIYFVLDESRLSISELENLIQYVGEVGYGKDASIGLGKYSVEEVQSIQWRVVDEANAVFTLAASCPQGLGFDPHYSFYHVQTRFGRHGNVQALMGKPFKKPILMAKTAAVYTLLNPKVMFIGQGVTGISDSLKETVHQGYAPVIPFVLKKDSLAI